MDLIGRGGLILRYYPGIRLEGVKKQGKTLVRIAGAEIGTRNLPSTKQE
jgi:hypothetical protein